MKIWMNGTGQWSRHSFQLPGRLAASQSALGESDLGLGHSEQSGGPAVQSERRPLWLIRSWVWSGRSPWWRRKQTERGSSDGESVGAWSADSSTAAWAGETDVAGEAFHENQQKLLTLYVPQHLDGLIAWRVQWKLLLLLFIIILSFHMLFSSISYSFLCLRKKMGKKTLHKMHLHITRMKLELAGIELVYCRNWFTQGTQQC